MLFLKVYYKIPGEFKRLMEIAEEMGTGNSQC